MLNESQASLFTVNVLVTNSSSVLSRSELCRLNIPFQILRKCLGLPFQVTLVRVEDLRHVRGFQVERKGVRVAQCLPTFDQHLDRLEITYSSITKYLFVISRPGKK